MNVRAVFVLLALSIGCSTRGPVGASTRGEPVVVGSISRPLSGGSMIPVLPDSPSIVLRSTHILQAVIEAAQPSQWVLDSPGLQRRTVEITLRLVEAPKGHVDAAPGARFHAHVAQYEWTGYAPDALPGLWSSVPIAVGTAITAFASSSSTSPGDLVIEPACTWIAVAPEAIADVKLAADSEAHPASVAALAAEAHGKAAALGWIFSEFLFARYGAKALDDPSVLDEILRVLEWPDLSLDARYALLDRVASAAGDERASSATIDRTVLSMARLFTLPRAEPLHEAILETRLPNVLGLSRGTARRRASDVFQSHPADLAKLRAALQTYNRRELTAPLLAWLAG